MKLSLKKLGVLGLSAVMAVSMSTAVFATTVSHTISVTEKYVESKFEYGKQGYVLKNKIDYTEEHETTGDIYSNNVSGVATGSSTSVSACKFADTGYNFTEATSTVYVNGSKYGELTDVCP